VGRDNSRREAAPLGVVVVRRQGQLLEVVLALQARRGGARLLHRGQQQAHQDADDSDHDEQLDQRQASAMIVLRESGHDWSPSNYGVSQILTVPSWLPEAMDLPSGLNTTLWTQFRWPRSVCVLPVADSRTLTVPSEPPQARRLPSGLK